MKIKTTDAARSLGIHPAYLLLHVSELDASLTFSDVWPEIDTAWVETIATTSGYRSALVERSLQPRLTPEPVSGLSKNAVHVLDKLSRQGKWGHVSVAIDSLQNITHVPKHDLEEVVSELRKAGLLDHDRTGRGTISLSPSKRKEIERIVQQEGRDRR